MAGTLVCVGGVVLLASGAPLLYNEQQIGDEETGWRESGNRR